MPALLPGVNHAPVGDYPGGLIDGIGSVAGHVVRVAAGSKKPAPITKPMTNHFMLYPPPAVEAGIRFAVMLPWWTKKHLLCALRVPLFPFKQGCERRCDSRVPLAPFLTKARNRPGRGT